MINHQPTELLGESITHWDEFYAKNFNLIFESSLKLMKSEQAAEKLTDRIFVKLLFAHPELYIYDNYDVLEKEISNICPEMQVVFDSRRHLSVLGLMDIYYRPN